MATATSQQRDIQERIRRGDLTGLNFAGFVRLSFERKSKKKAKQQRPSFYMTGEDVDQRATQEERCRNYVEAHGGRYVYTFDEPDTSAWKRKRVVNPDGTVSWEVIRPRFDEMIKCMQQGVAPNGEPVNGLIVADIDRMTRDHRHLEDAIDVAIHHGKAFIDITGSLDLFTASGQDNARFLVTVKGRQSTNTSIRVSNIHYDMAVAGIPVGGSRPFGWNDDKRTLHPVESKLIRKAREDILFGGIGIHTVCREWRQAGIKTPKGRDFVRQVVREVLLSPRLAGYRVYREEICLDHDGKPVMGQYEPILTVGEWEELRDFLTDPGRHTQSVHAGGRKYFLIRYGTVRPVWPRYAVNIQAPGLGVAASNRGLRSSVGRGVAVVDERCFREDCGL